jgi:hypothetical protein
MLVQQDRQDLKVQLVQLVRKVQWATQVLKVQ